MSILNLPQTIEAVLIAFSSTIVSYYSTTIHCILFIARAIRRTIVITEYPISFTLYITVRPYIEMLHCFKTYRKSTNVP